MKKIEITWSYQSSPNAVKFGFARSGCWTVSTQEGIRPPVAKKAFREKADAEQFAASLRNPPGLYRDTPPAEIAEEIVEQLAELCDEEA